MANEAPHTVGILTALPEVELRACLLAFGRTPEDLPDDKYEGERYWFLSSDECKRRGIRVVVSCFGASGNTESGLPVERFIRRHKPELLIFVGIACGIRTLKLGDVVTGELVWAYEYVKTTGAGPLDRSRASSISTFIREDVHFFGGHSQWQKLFSSIHESLPESQRAPLSVNPQLHRSIWIASGEKVMANGELARLNAMHDLIRAGEMEGYGFAHACEDRRPPVPWLVVRGISDYGDRTKDGLANTPANNAADSVVTDTTSTPEMPLVPAKDAFHLPAALAAATFARIFVETYYTLARSSRPRQTVSARYRFSDSLIDVLEELASRGQYETILRYRDTFSRFLWVEGLLKERVKLGRIADEAAVNCDNRKAQIAALLDDVGWSLIALRQWTKAKRALSHGLELARANKDPYWIAKAHRHLAGLYLGQEQLPSVFNELQMAEKYTTKIADRRARLEMLAGIMYGRAVGYTLQRQLSQSRKCLRQLETLWKRLDDPSRAVRIYALKARVFELSNDHATAKDLYRSGLQRALQIGRRDEVIRNHLGLSRTYAATGDASRSQKHKAEAEAMLATTPIPHEPLDGDKPL